MKSLHFRKNCWRELSKKTDLSFWQKLKLSCRKYFWEPTDLRINPQNPKNKLPEVFYDFLFNDPWLSTKKHWTPSKPAFIHNISKQGFLAITIAKVSFYESTENRYTNNLAVTYSLELCYKEENYQKKQNLHIEVILLNYNFQ